MPFSPLRGRQRLEGARELLGGNRREGLAAHRAARAELDGDLGHRLLIGRLDDRDEVVLPERGPLLLDRDAELFDLLVDLLHPRRVVLQRLHAIGSQIGEHYECRHSFLPLLVNCPSFAPLSLTFGGAVQSGSGHETGGAWRRSPALRASGGVDIISACPSTRSSLASTTG